MSIELKSIDTEQRNPASLTIDQHSTLEMLKIINDEDKKVALALEQALPQLSDLVDASAKALQQGARLVYIGAGTSGRLGVLDASECPPTYGVPANWVVGIIAGGDQALRHAVEHAEDNAALAVTDLQAINLKAADVLVGIAASGRTPYVLGALQYAKELGCTTGAIVCSKVSPVADVAQIAVRLLVGPEVVTGSTRMKSGTATKLALNMISTGAMIKLGKVFGNLMVDVKPTNAKLEERQRSIVMQATGVTRDQAQQSLAQTQGNCKLAIFMLLSNLDLLQAEQKLDQAGGVISLALKS
jgi:N-acetylmuramic acid 6-phosphate etherase